MDTRLLEPSWPGEVASDELTFVKNSLKAERRLRTQWGFVRGTGRVSEAAIRSVAMRGLPDNRWHNTALVKGCRGLEVAPSTALGGSLPKPYLYKPRSEALIGRSGPSLKPPGWPGAPCWANRASRASIGRPALAQNMVNQRGGGRPGG
jgi:hypothetical protein